MSFKSLFTFILFILSISMGINAQEKTLTLQDLIPGGKTYSRFVPRNLRQLQWVGDQYLYVKGDTLLIGTPGKKIEKEITLQHLNETLSVAGKNTISSLPSFFVPCPDRPEVAFVHKYHRYHYDFLNEEVTADYSLDSLWSNYEFAPVSGLLAFTEGNNIRILTLDNKVVDVTRETTPGIVCGQAVHQREFGIYKGLFWSPSGDALAFYRMDETMVTDYPLVNISARCAKAEPFTYPMAGMKSHQVTVGVFYPATGKTIWLQTGLPKEKYLTNISWSPDGAFIYIAELNRDQNEMQLVCYDAATGEKAGVLFGETSSTYVEPQHPVLFLPGNSRRFIWQSERDGYNHLYLYTTEGELVKPLTSGSWVVKSVLGFDKKGEHVFILSTESFPGDPAGNATAMDTYAWKVNLKNGRRTCLTPVKGVHQALLSATGNYLIDSYSSPIIPRKIELVRVANGQRQKLLEAKDPFRNYTMPVIEAGQIKAADGVTELNYRIVKPHNTDETKKYPAIVYVYGGPHAQLVNGSWQYGVRGWDLYMAQKGYIVFTVDGRGSASRGHAFESAIFRNLGENEMADQLKGVDFLKSLPYVDQERIGVHGWSYGGFMTTNLMLTYPEVFKAGVAGGPVIDWHLYEIMYGERYMDHPKTNPDGYKRANLNLRADRLKGRLLLIHGDMDPVVVWQHSLGFLKACVEAGTYPDYFVYPGHKHNVTGKDRPHLYEKITRYFEDFL
ncbi:MAG: S9 family peptidase [Tannerellaceae bacterium]|nr:S9 family peptidase [Tannerellaceae bacterium]